MPFARHSIIGAGGLNCRVRNGNRVFPLRYGPEGSNSIGLVTLWVCKPNGLLVQLGFTPCGASTCCLSTWWSSTALQGALILGWASRLDAFSAYPVAGWLPGATSGEITGTPEPAPSRSSRTRDGPPQGSCARGG